MTASVQGGVLADSCPASDDFRDRLVVREIRGRPTGTVFRGMLAGSGDGSFRIFEQIPAGRFKLSIQASGFHYSTPRSAAPIGQHTHWEIGLMLNGELTQPRNEPEFSADPELAELAELWESGDVPVAGYVQTADVQRLYELLQTAGVTP